MNTKSRLLPGNKTSWTNKAWSFTDQSGNTTFLGSPGSLQSGGFQVTESESHDRVNGRYLSGGPFYTDKVEQDLVPRCYSRHSKMFANKFVWIEENISNQPILFPKEAMTALHSIDFRPRSKDTSDLDPDGATAVAQCAPTNPVSELGVGVSELYREGLPRLPGIQTWRRRADAHRKRYTANSAGSEYLNKVFGWDPLIAEVESFASIVQKHRDVLKQYERDEGNNVRRSFYFTTDVHEDVLASGFGRASIAGATNPSWWGELAPGEWTITRRDSVKRWFNGCFTYGLPSQGDTWKKALGYGTDADKIAGASLNPELLWNLTPWSWAVDWFSNTGDVISNISDYVRAGLVMRYGYMMETTQSSLILTMNSSGWKDIPAPRDITISRTTKVRRAANPFGFEISFSDMSTEQVLIAAALGLTFL